MRSGWLMLAGLALGGAQMAQAADYALVAPSTISKKQAKAPAAVAIVTSAQALLDRPPAPLATVHVEGTLPGKGIYDQSRLALRDLPVARHLAVAWRLTGDRRYLRAADRYLSAWASIYQPSFNPIDETGFDGLITAYDLTEADLPQATRRKMDDLLRRMATGYLDRMETGKVVPVQTLTNNWQSHRVKLATLAAFQLGDPALIARARDAYQKQVGTNLRPDGAPLDFAMRDALHYAVFTLEPLSVAAYAAKMHGQDWYGYTAPGGSSLGRSLEWLAAYARGEKTHIEFARSVVPFDKQRREAGVAGFANEAWKPAEAAQLYAIASLLDPRYAPLRDALPAPESDEKSRDQSDIWDLLTARPPRRA